MKYNKTLIELLGKYRNWAKFDWCWFIKSTNDKMYLKDLEENKFRSISYFIQCMLDNGMLDECFSQQELEELYSTAPNRFKEEIKLYIKK